MDNNTHSQRRPPPTRRNRRTNRKINNNNKNNNNKNNNNVSTNKKKRHVIRNPNLWIIQAFNNNKKKSIMVNGVRLRSVAPNLGLQTRKIEEIINRGWFSHYSPRFVYGLIFEFGEDLSKTKQTGSNSSTILINTPHLRLTNYSSRGSNNSGRNNNDYNHQNKTTCEVKYSSSVPTSDSESTSSEETSSSSASGFRTNNVSFDLRISNPTGFQFFKTRINIVPSTSFPFNLYLEHSISYPPIPHSSGSSSSFSPFTSDPFSSFLTSTTQSSSYSSSSSSREFDENIEEKNNASNTSFERQKHKNSSQTTIPPPPQVSKTTTQNVQTFQENDQISETRQGTHQSATRGRNKKRTNRVATNNNTNNTNDTNNTSNTNNNANNANNVNNVNNVKRTVSNSTRSSNMKRRETGGANSDKLTNKTIFRISWMKQFQYFTEFVLKFGISGDYVFSNDPFCLFPSSFNTSSSSSSSRASAPGFNNIKLTGGIVTKNINASMTWAIVRRLFSYNYSMHLFNYQNLFNVGLISEFDFHLSPLRFLYSSSSSSSSSTKTFVDETFSVNRIGIIINKNVMFSPLRGDNNRIGMNSNNNGWKWTSLIYGRSKIVNKERENGIGLECMVEDDKSRTKWVVKAEKNLNSTHSNFGFLGKIVVGFLQEFGGGWGIRIKGDSEGKFGINLNRENRRMGGGIRGTGAENRRGTGGGGGGVGGEEEGRREVKVNLIAELDINKMGGLVNLTHGMKCGVMLKI